ncbi:MFS transporter, DHA2 family, glioxin efflux transporter, partial [Tremellales sp. Uapishka_1]
MVDVPSVLAPPVTSGKENRRPPPMTARTSSFPTPPAFQPLTRSSTATSLHAQNALRRMATTETGEMEEAEVEAQNRLDTHAEGEAEEDHDVEKTAGVDKKAKAVQLQDQTNLLPVKQVILIFCGLTCALFCSLIDQTIVTTALPTLGKVFNRADISSWVGTAYLLTSTALQPIYGRLSDIFGRKFVLLGSLGIFLIGSLACCLAQSMIQLIVFRAIQGIGGGGILTLSMIIISDVVSLKERGKYQGITGVVVALSNSIGPILGGVFTEKLTWRWCFYINLPLTCAAIVIIVFLLPLKRVEGGMVSKLKKLDYYGSVLTLAWVVLFLLGISWAGTQYSWSSAAVLAPIIVGIFLLGVFLYVEARLVPLPLVPMHIFKNRIVASSMASTFFSGSCFYAVLYYLPTYFQIVKGASAIHSGVLILPLVVIQTVTAFTSGMLVSKTGDYRWNIIIGFGVWTIGLGLLSTASATTSTAKLVGYQILVGLGAGQTFQTSLIAIQASVDRKDMATATGMRNFLRQLGGTVALAVCSTIINNLVRKRLNALNISAAIIDQVIKDPTQIASLAVSPAEITEIIQAYSKGINACFYFMIPLTGIAFFLTILFTKQVSLKRDDDKARKEEAKVWLEARKEKHRKGKNGQGESRDEKETYQSSTGDDESRPNAEVHVVGESDAPGPIEAALEDTAREFEEAAGVGDIDPANRGGKI